MPYITSVERRGLEKGLAKGRQEALLDILETRFGKLPETMSTRLAELSDLNELKHLTRLAASVETLQGFTERLG